MSNVKLEILNSEPEKQEEEEVIQLYLKKLDGGVRMYARRKSDGMEDWFLVVRPNKVIYSFPNDFGFGFCSVQPG